MLSHETSIDCSHKTINYKFLGKKQKNLQDTGLG